MTDVIVVESPAKAKTINKYLGNQYTVLASLGHVRDLPPKDGSVRPDENFAMDWESDERGAKQIKAIAQALRHAKNLYLATDPDREGEAISWHVRAMLEEKKLLKNINVQRVTFNEITKQAVQYAMANPRELDQPLIEAYLARRALDYLVGFTLSPVLWRKLPGSRSAGRVQSVSLRLICEREAEIEVFQSREYWTITGTFLTASGASFTARLTHLDGKKLEQFDLPDQKSAEKARSLVESNSFSVSSIERKKVKRNPSPPFTTSTLQQESSRKLYMTAQNTMRTAQQLYEGIDLGGETVGLITYMRTDGVQMANEAIQNIRSYIETHCGKSYLPPSPRSYSSKAKNAQEAHEAIRPTDVKRTPESVASYLTEDQKRLYELIWKRAVASQMQSAELDQVTVTLNNSTQQIQFRATGSIVSFDGFLKLYSESTDESDSNKKGTKDEQRMLPPMQEKESVHNQEILPEQHFTQPPPRYTEASLVKKMEELGIGRPSTYASILGVLRDRDYVHLENRHFIPQDRGRLVTSFLTSFFRRYVDIDFTANLEEKLDDISGGKAQWKTVLQNFWEDFSKAVAQTKELKISDVIDALDHDLGSHFFSSSNENSDPRQCQACGTGKLHLKLGRYGAFIGCSNYPECQYTRKLGIESASEHISDELLKEGLHLLGQHPQTGEAITIKKGPWGLYIQQGEPNPEDKKSKPKRMAIPRGVDSNTLTLEQAIRLLGLPRQVGQHPETGEMIEAGLGRFGPYVKMGKIFASLDKDEDVLSVGLNRAVDLLAQKLSSIHTIGQHPKDQESILLRKGRFGFYLQHGKMMAPLPKGQNQEEITLEQAVALLKEKGKESKRKKTTPPKTNSKRTTNKKEKKVKEK